MGQIHFTLQDHIAIVTLDNQDKRNAVDPDMRTGLEEAYARIVSDNDIRVAIITGAGSKAFCSGGDIQAYRDAGVFGEGAADLPPIPRPKDIWKPFIAAINGYAVGGGFPLALSCDLRVAGKSAMIGSTGLRLGAVQGAQQSQLLPRLIGISKALEILLLSKIVSGEEAAGMGMVHVVVEDDEVMSTALEWAKTIAGYSPWAVQQTKRLVYEGFNMDLNDAYAWEARVTQEGYKRIDAAQGFKSFLDKE